MLNNNLADDIKKLEKDRAHVTKKAKVFKKQQLSLYLVQPNTLENLWRKVRIIIGVHLAGRHGDLKFIQFCDVKRLTRDEDGQVYYTIRFERVF